MLILCISNDDLFICQCACLRCIIFPSLQDSYMYAIAEIDVKIFFSLEVQKSFSLIGSRIIFTVCLDFTKLVEKCFWHFV